MASKLLIVGAGGFGRVTLEHASRQFDCAFVDDGQAIGAVVDGVEVVGGSSDLQRLHIPIFHMEAGKRCKDECLPEESSFFTSVGHPFPAVCIRTSTERPEALDKGCFVLAGIDEKSLLQAVDTAVQMNLDGDDGLPVPDYVDENVSTKVVKIIQSYTGVVNKMVWRKG